MADVTDRRLIESLDVSFDAAVTRGEDEAAYDLALSLLQGRSLTDIAAREGAWDLRRSDGRRLPVTLVGRDFIGAGTPPSVLVPAGRAVLLEATTTTTALRPSDTSLIEELRGLAGIGASVQVEAAGDSFLGVLARVGPDHVLLRTKTGEVMVGLEGISLVALLRGDDAL